MIPNKTSSTRNGIHLFRSLAKRGPIDTHTPQRLQAIANSVGYLPQPDSNILLLKIPDTYGIKDGEI